MQVLSKGFKANENISMENKTQEEEAQSLPNILDLPEEILVNILEYLDVVDIIK